MMERLFERYRGRTGFFGWIVMRWDVWCIRREFVRMKRDAR